MNSYVYNDKEDVFEREPFVVHFTSPITCMLPCISPILDGGRHQEGGRWVWWGGEGEAVDVRRALVFVKEVP